MTINETYKRCQELLDIIYKEADEFENNKSASDDKTFEVKKEYEDELTNLSKVLVSFISTRITVSLNSLYGCVLMQLVLKCNYKLDRIVNLHYGTLEVELQYNPLLFYRKTFKEIFSYFVGELNIFVNEIPLEYKRQNPNNDQKKHKSLVSATDVMEANTLLADQRNDNNKIKDWKDKNPNNNPIITIPKELYTLNKLRLESDKNVVDGKDFYYYYDVYYKYVNPPSDDQSGVSDQKNPLSNNFTDKSRDYENMDEENAKGKTDNIITKAFESMGEADRGDLPGSLIDKIKKLKEPPKINWRVRFKNKVASIPYGKRSTKTKPNRRIPTRYDLSGKLPSRILKIVLAEDTSGSVSNKDHEYIFREIFGILGDVKAEITYIQFDTDIKLVQKLKNKEDLTGEIRGYGGTSFTPVINYVNENAFRDAILVFFTDGMGEREIPKPLVQSVMWVLTDKKEYLSLSPEKTYGEVLTLLDDPDYRREREHGRFY